MNTATTLQAPPMAPEGTITATHGKPSADTFQAYADGSSLGNPGPAGWAVVLRERDAPGEPIKMRVVVGSAARATNNAMELEAATMALTSLPPDARGTVWCDARYVVDGLNAWLPKWEANGWKTSNGKSVANRSEWQTLAALWRQRPGVNFKWVQGHSGKRYNELADRLARTEAEKVQAGLPPVARLERGQ